MKEDAWSTSGLFNTCVCVFLCAHTHKLQKQQTALASVSRLLPATTANSIQCLRRCIFFILLLSIQVYNDYSFIFSIFKK